MTAAATTPPPVVASSATAAAGATPLRDRLGSLKARMAFVLGLVLLLPAAYAIFQALSVYTAQGERQAASLREDAAAVSGRQAELLAGVRVLLE